MGTRMKKAVEHISQMLNPKEPVISIQDVRYNFNQMLEFLTEYENRYDFKEGARVRLKEKIEKSDDNWGWHNSIHF